LDGSAPCRLQLRDCVISSLGGMNSEAAGTFIEQVGNGATPLDFHGANNCYYNLGYLWTGSPGQDGKQAVAVSDLEAFRERSGSDEKSFVLTSSPWAAQNISTLLQTHDLKRAFQLKTDLPQLRQTRNRSQMIGVERCVWGNSYEGLLALDDPAQA